MKLTKNLVLIGMRGSGKSAIGKILAETLNCNFIDIDQTIEKNENKTIPEIVKKHNWKHFRDLESKYTTQTAEQKNTVIATGGGVILREKNMRILKKNSIIIFIHSPIKQLAKRIAKDNDRPSLTGKTPQAELSEIWKARKTLYKKYADIQILFDFETDDKEADIAKKAQLIIDQLATRSEQKRNNQLTN
jgi:shikimate kinase